MMPSPRTRRLMLDSEMLQKRFAGWPRIKIVESSGSLRRRTEFPTHSKVFMPTQMVRSWSAICTYSKSG